MIEGAIRIVFVDEQQESIQLVEDVLGKAGINAALISLQDSNGFIRQLQEGSLPHLVLVCYHEQRSAGLDCLRLHKKLAPQVPAIVISPALGEELAIEIMREGAADIVLRDKLYKLPAAILRAINEAEYRTNQLQAEQIPALNQQQLRDLFKMTPVGVFRCDADKNCFYVNDRYCELTGLQPEDAFGTGWINALHPEDRERVVQGWYERKAIVEETKAIFRYQKPVTGEIVWVIGQSISETDGQGNVTGYLGSITNITRLKLVEEALKEKNDYLTKVNKELDSFVYSASHNLRAPLTSLMGLINLMRLEIENPLVLQRICNMMEHSLERLDGFIRDILDHSRNSRLVIEYRDVDAKALIQEVLEEFSLQDGYEKIKVNVHMRQEAPLFTDPARLRIIIRNLVSNCIRYKSMISQPQIDITARIATNEAVFQVNDNGIGIRQEHQSKVFDMFYRADEHRSGSGLGLYITREVVEKMGGSIELSSEPSKGTTVKIRLPNQQADGSSNQQKDEVSNGWSADYN